MLGMLILVNVTFSQTIQELLDGYYAYNRFQGSVLIMEGEKTIFQKGYGYADEAGKILNDQNTVFDLGSVSKTMTAVAILKLHDEGKLSVYDRVDTYIPNFINDKTDSITIINLLNHTSGISANLGRFDEDGKGIVLPGSEAIAPEDLIEKFRASKLKSKPGKIYEYNNYGYTLLAYIIEKVSGMSYQDYIRTAITSKLGMNSTAYKLDLQNITAVGYSGIGMNTMTPAKDQFHPSWIIGAGYMYSNTKDLAKYVHGVFSSELFSKETLSLMMDTCVETRKSNRMWALGWAKQKTEDVEWYTHGGGIFGFSTRIVYIPKTDQTIIVLSNLVKDLNFDEIYSAKFSFVDEITENIIRLLNGKEVKTLAVPKGKPDKKICGSYYFDDLHSATIEIENDSLFLTTSGNEAYGFFDYIYKKEIADTSGKAYPICTLFSEAILSGNFEGIDAYANKEMKERLFNEKGIGKIKSAWKSYTEKSGQFQSYSICNKTGNNYLLAFHYEKSEIIMQLSFSNDGFIQGLFFYKVLPKCTVQRVHIESTGNDTFFIDGYTYGGYSDYSMKYEKAKKRLYITTDNESFTAIKQN